MDSLISEGRETDPLSEVESLQAFDEPIATGRHEVGEGDPFPDIGFRN